MYRSNLAETLPEVDEFTASKTRAQKRLGRREFQVWLLLADAKTEIASRLAPHARQVRPRWKNGVEGDVNPGYGSSLLDYMGVVNAERVVHAAMLRGLGSELAALGDGLGDSVGKRRREHIVQLKQEFIHVVQQLRHDPHKGPGMAFFAPDGGLIAYEAGNLWRPELPFSRAEQIELLESYSRRQTAICGERTTIARAAGIDYPSFDHACGEHGDGTPKPLIDRAAAFMARHNLDIYLGSGETDAFRGSTLHIAIKVCGSCLPAVVNAGVAEIISDTDATSNGIRHIRQASMDAMTKNLPPHIAHREITRQVPITLG